MPTPQRRRFVPRIRALACVLLASACTATGAKKSSTDADDGAPKRPIADIVEASNKPEPIGQFLASLDGAMRRWNELQLTGTTRADREKARKLELWLATEAHGRRQEIIEQLETGARQNRVVAAMALGFTRDVQAQSPLLAALDDREPEVVANALLGLWLLERDDTPLDKICALVRLDREASVRTNASLCLMTLTNKGARSPCAVEAARLGLLDDEPSVRNHCALTLGNLLDKDSLVPLAEHLTDPVPIVALACAKSVAHIGRALPTEKGRAARALAAALDESKGPVHDELRLRLVELAGADHGKDSKDWIEWAMRLP